MMRAWGWVAVPAMASTLLACSLLKKPGAADGGADGGDVQSALPVEGGPAEAVNESELTRYPDEKPVDHATLTAEAGGNMRTQAGPGGDLVIVLKHGTEVQKIAEHANYYLVIADDPKEPTRKLMGWAAESVFGGEPSHRHEAAMGDGGVSPAKAVDAGTKPVGVDAGAKPAPVPAKPLDVKKVNGACPTGYAPCSAICRLTCKAPSDCDDPSAHCTAGFCLGPGASVCK
jgi:hypothetical protein